MSLKRAFGNYSGSPQEVANADQLHAGVPKGFISGMQLIWVSSTSISVGPGCAHIESNGEILYSDSTVTVSGLSLSASTKYYIYIYNDASGPTVLVSSVAPASPYSGTASSKSADSAKRYIGYLLTDPSGNIRPFNHFTGSGLYLFRTLRLSGTQWTRVVNGGTETTATTVDCSSLLPPNCTGMRVFLINTGTQPVVISASGDPLDGTNWQTYAQNGTRYTYELAFSSGSQSFKYLSSPSGGILFVDIVGAYLPR